MQIELASLQIRAHGPVKDDHLLANKIKERATHGYNRIGLTGQGKRNRIHPSIRIHCCFIRLPCQGGRFFAREGESNHQPMIADMSPE
jgi:hypothetical protein